MVKYFGAIFSAVFLLAASQAEAVQVRLTFEGTIIPFGFGTPPPPMDPPERVPPYAGGIGQSFEFVVLFDTDTPSRGVLPSDPNITVYDAISAVLDGMVLENPMILIGEIPPPSAVGDGFAVVAMVPSGGGEFRAQLTGNDGSVFDGTEPSVLLGIQLSDFSDAETQSAANGLPRVTTGEITSLRVEAIPLPAGLPLLAGGLGLLALLRRRRALAVTS